MHHVSRLDIRRAPASPAPDSSAPPGQWALPLDGNLALEPVPAYPHPTPSGPAGAPPPRPALSVVSKPADAGARPDVLHANATRFVQALVEVAAGDRPVGQLARWMTPVIYESFAERLRTLGRARTSHGAAAAPRSRVVSVHVRKPTGASAEIAARIVQGRRSRALALRLEVRDDSRHRERWMCTALDWG